MTKVLITMDSVHYDLQEGTQEGQEYSSQCVGVVHSSDDEIRIVYETGDAQSGELSTQTLLIGPDYVKISRPDMGDDYMHFTSGEVTEFISRTMYGDIFMNIDTKELNICKKEKEVVIFIHYFLSVAGDAFTECRMNLNVKTV